MNKERIFFSMAIDLYFLERHVENRTKSHHEKDNQSIFVRHNGTTRTLTPSVILFRIYERNAKFVFVPDLSSERNDKHLIRTG